MIKVYAEVEFFAEEPGFNERNFVVLPFRTHLRTQAHFLAAAHEVGWIENIEIPLRQFHEAEDAINRAEPGAERDVAGITLINCNNQVLSIGDISRFGMCIHALEELRSLKALLALLYADHVEHFAGRYRKFASNDAVLCLGVALDLDLFDVRLVAFLNLVKQIHSTGLHVWLSPGGDGDIDVPSCPVHIIDDLDIPRQSP